MQLTGVNFTVYQYFDGVKSKAVNVGFQDVKAMTEKLSRGDFIDRPRSISYKNNNLSTFHDRPLGHYA